MNFAILTYEDLTPEQQNEVPDNGHGMELATYIQATHLGKVLWLQSDAMEPEDVYFYRDLSWIKPALIQAYNIGLGTYNPQATDGDSAKDLAPDNTDGDGGTEAPQD